jgi:tRNA(adenine34) deaminase
VSRKEETLRQMQAESEHEPFMRLAMAQARAAAQWGDVPIGAVIVQAGSVVAAAGNRRAVDGDPVAHAELLAIRAAAAAIGDWRLTECTLYVTLEPCIMCAGAIILARLPRVVYGAGDPKAGAAGSMYSVLLENRLNHQPQMVPGVLAEECGRLLTEFFRAQRKLGKK